VRRRKNSDAWCYEILRRLRWPEGIICPRCKQGRVTNHSKFAASSRRRYLCLSCRRTFSDLTGTPFARTNLPLDIWFLSLDLVGQSMRTSELARALGVKWDTTLYIERRINSSLHSLGLLQRLRQAIKERQHE